MDALVSFDRRWPGRTLAEHASLSPSSVWDRTLPSPGVALGVTVDARVSGGRWIARCPTVGCVGAEYVNLADPYFFCCECRNAAVAHQPIRVAVPSVETQARVEDLLLARPSPATRNWEQTDSTSQLEAENTAQGWAT